MFKKTAYNDIIIGVGLSLLAMIIWWQYKAPVARDMGIYIYGGQALLRGDMPYVNVFDVKPPLTFFVGALVALLQNLSGWSVILCNRIVLELCAAGAVGFTYLLTKRLIGDRLWAIIAGIVLLSFTGVGGLGGPPKILVMMTSMAGLVFLDRNKLVTAGACFGLAALAWQPAAVFAIFSVICSVISTKGGREAKWTTFMRLGMGILVPVFVVSFFFLTYGALTEMVAQAVYFPFTLLFARSELNPEGGLSDGVVNFFQVLREGYGAEMLFFVLGGAGLILLLKNKERRVWHQEPVWAVIISSLLSLIAWNILDQCGWPDLLPLLPLVAVFVAYLFAWIHAYITRDLYRKIVLVLFFSFIILYGLGPLGKYQNFKQHLTGEQKKVAGFVRENSAEGERILSILAPDILAVSERRNINKYVLLARADLLYINRTQDIARFRLRIQQKQPSLVVLGAGGYGRWVIKSLRLKAFLSRHYEKKVNTSTYAVYQRVDQSS